MSTNPSCLVQLNATQSVPVCPISLVQARSSLPQSESDLSTDRVLREPIWTKLIRDAFLQSSHSPQNFSHLLYFLVLNNRYVSFFILETECSCDSGLRAFQTLMKTDSKRRKIHFYLRLNLLFVFHC
jgi:hypothetical protein